MVRRKEEGRRERVLYIVREDSDINFKQFLYRSPLFSLVFDFQDLAYPPRVR